MPIVNGTTYHDETPESVIKVLESARQQGHRIKLYYGDPKTGRDWQERYDVTGTIGRSMGPTKVPILLANKRSTGGGAILDHCIVLVTMTRKPRWVLYQHPKYHT